MPKTIDEVISQLLTIVKDARKTQSRYGYFASLYLDMTRSVKLAIHQNKFEDGVRMEKLCVTFAGRYLDAFHLWKKKEHPTQSWALAFEQTSMPNLTVIQHLLCGINAHINLDLGIAAALTCPGIKIHELKTDFDTINHVIASLVDKTQLKLEKISWPMKWLDRIGKNYDEKIANFSIGMAREASWIAAMDLAILSSQEQVYYISKLDKRTAALAKLIINPGFAANVFLKPIKWFETKDRAKIMDILAN